MHSIKVAVASLNQTPLDWDHNAQNIIQAILEARNNKATVLCCPELCITGYGCEDLFQSKSTLEMSLKLLLEEIAPVTHGMIVAVGLPLLYQADVYNTVCLLVDGKIAGFVAKQNLADRGVYYEPRWFKAWPLGLQTEIMIDGKFYPLGDLIFEIGDLKLGFEICEDAWVPKRTGIYLAKRGVDLILNASASHFEFGKSDIRKALVIEGAKQFGVGYLYANLLGNEAGRLIYDGDTLIAAGNNLIADGPRFSFQDRTLSFAIIDIQSLRWSRSVPNEEHGIKIPFSGFSEHLEIKQDNSKHTFHKINQLSAEEEFAKAIALGLFDYCRKTQAKGFVLNLSGGADSSACACLVYLMVCLGLQELGAKLFQEKLNLSSPFKKLADSDLATFFLQQLLICLYQKTENNTDLTLHSAQVLTDSLHIPFFTLAIDPLIKEYDQLAQSVIGRTLNWQEDDIALQNIQSRVRGPAAWMVANIKEKIFLSTCNRSEAAVGYTTMDGDTCGGLSPLAGVHKSFIIQWLKWLEQKGLPGFGPIPALKAVNHLRASAELRSLSTHQTDEADLMPYAYLDRIETLFIRDKLSPLEIFKVLNIEIPIVKNHILVGYIERFIQLWTRNQWKRERLAPAFHVDTQSIDPKTWCRYPILSGAFKREMAELWKLINEEP